MIISFEKEKLFLRYHFYTFGQILYAETRLQDFQKI